jgi:hypothetical protein
MKSLGCLALVCYAVHAGFHLYHGRPEDLLWACHVGAAVVGLGLILSSATLNGMGVLLLCMGTPLWLLDLAGGGEFYPTSCFTHLGGLAIGIYGLYRLGMARGTWWKTSITLVALIGFCRVVTPEHANVNVAFAIERGWESYFPSHGLYLTAMIAEATIYFLVLEIIVRRGIKWRTDNRQRPGISSPRASATPGPLRVREP